MPCRAALRSRAHARLLLALLLGISLALTACSPAAATPSIASVTPASGPVSGGQQVTITGSGFAGACAGSDDIWFGTDLESGYAISPANYQVLSDTQILVTVPASFGGTVDVRVHDACGTSPVSSGDHFTYTYPTTQCLSGTCAITVSRTPVGALGHVALGFLDGFNTDAGIPITSRDTALVDALHPRQWRLGQAGTNEPGGGVFGLARGAGALISLDLTSDWEDWAYTNDRAAWQTPYTDLATYSTFIANDVRQRLNAGQVPDYFDVWNEPASTGTINQWLSVYGAAYHAIEAADPGAQVVGPSIASFLLPSAGQENTPGYEISLTDFLNWEMSTGVRMAAVSWHEDGTTVPSTGVAPFNGVPDAPVPGGQRDYWSPEAIAAHVLAARALIAGYPPLRGTQVFVNEYGPTYAVNVPGWMVGDFAALEGSGAAQGMITCVTGAACTNLLDGLIGSDGSPQMPYWVMQAYARMSGQRIFTTSTGTNLYVLASETNAAGALQALVGRADDCWGGQQCPQFQTPSAAAVQLSVGVAIPWATSLVSVSVEPLRNSATNPVGANDVAAQPSATTMVLPVRCGVATVTLPSVGDGDAFFLSVTPASTSTSAARTVGPALSAAAQTPAIPAPRLCSSGTANPPAATASSARPASAARSGAAATRTRARRAVRRRARRRAHRIRRRRTKRARRR